MKKIIIAGGSGFLGQELIKYFGIAFDEIIILSRTKKENYGKIKYVVWDAKTLGVWCNVLEGATAVINLCGKSVDCRYTEKNKAEIFASRLDSTKIIGEAIQKCKLPPTLWINGASATIYRHSETEPMTESKGIIGEGFSVEVCKAWEKVFNDFELTQTRKINMRISMVMGKTGGVYPALINVVKKYLGGTMGKGTQQVSWVHIDDFCNMIEWFIINKNRSGIYNCVAPNPVKNKELMKLLRTKASISIALPAASWMLEIGAFFLRTETELILKSRYSYPEKALNEGFVFKCNDIKSCLQNL
jgi:uncharacterized protein (TIGR01777 family)